MDGTKVYWCAGDQIYVKGAPEAFTNALEGDETAARAAFTGEVEPADSYYAVYPYVESWDGNSAMTKLPVIQKAANGTFGNGYNITAAKTTSQDMTFGFKNVLGHVKFTSNLPEGSISSVIVTANGGEKISGNIMIGVEADVPVAEALDAKAYTVLSFDNKLAEGEYYIAMLPGEYTQGLTFDFVASDGYVATVYVDYPITLKAGHINPIGTIDNLTWYDPSEGSENSIWKGKFVTGDEGQMVCKDLAGDKFDWYGVTPGDTLRIYGYTSEYRPETWSMSLVGISSSKALDVLPEKYEKAETVSIELTQEVLDEICLNEGLGITGVDYCFTNIEIIPAVVEEPEEPIIPGEGETVIWEGKFVSGTWGGNTDLSWDKYDWSQHNPGDVLKIYGGPTDPEAENWVLSLRVGDGWDFLAGVPQYLNKVYDYTVTLTQEMIDDLVARGGLVVQGDNYTMRMITVKEGEVSEDGEVSVVLWEGSTNLGTDWSTAVQIQGPAKIPYGAKLHVEYETPEGVGDGYYQIKFCYIGADWGWVQMESHLPYANDYGCVTLVTGSSHYALPLIDADVDAINNGKGLVIQGYAATITKVYYTIGGESEDGESVLWEGELLVDDWSNQPYALSDAGVELKQAGAKAGQFVNFYVEPLSDYWKLKIIEGHWGATYMSLCAAGSDTEGGEFTEWDLASNGGTIQLELTQEILDAAFTQQWWGGTFVLNGDDLKVTKITLQ